MKHREKGWGWPACPLSVPWKLCNDASPAPSHSPSTHSPLHTLWNYFAKSKKCLKWFVFFDINSFWKIHMYSKHFQMLLTTSLHYFCSAITSLNSVGWLVHTVKGPLPENRVFTLHYPTSIQASQTFSHHLSSFVHNTGHSILDPAPMPPWSLKSLSPLPCAPFCPPTTHCQGTANSVSPYAGPGVHVSTVFYNYQFFFSAKRTILHIHRLPSKRRYSFFFFFASPWPCLSSLRMAIRWCHLVTKEWTAAWKPAAEQRKVGGKGCVSHRPGGAFWKPEWGVRQIAMVWGYWWSLDTKSRLRLC